MAFDALDSLLRDQQYAIAKRSNFDLPFGGTTEAEFDFLAKNGAVNTMAPNFLSFMAGISATNLATQANRQQQFEQFGKLRDMNSALDQRRAVTRNTILDGDKAEQLMPYVAPQAQANLSNTLAGIDATRENTYGQYLQNQFYPETIQSQNNYRNAQTVGQGLQNDLYTETTRSQNAYRDAQLAGVQANTVQQNFVNDNLRAREDLYFKDKNSDIAYRDALAGSQQAIQSLNKAKADSYAKINQLNIDYQNQRITKAQYDAEIAKKKAEAFDIEREEERLYNNAKTAAANARANQIGNRAGNYYVPPTVVNQNPVPTPPPQQTVPPQSGLGMQSQNSSGYYVPSLPNQRQPATSRTGQLPSNANSVLDSAIIKQANGQPLSSEESAVLGVVGLLSQGSR
mgnify:CR=1 FL=1|jgi:hypothetical protein